MNNQRILYSTVLVLLAFTTLFGQDKFEREKRISDDEVPADARRFIASLPFEKKIKWYHELSHEGTSFEAKTKHQKKCHSIEFDTLGNLLDIEIKIDWTEIPPMVRQGIETYFSQKYKKYKVKKIQQQYLGEPEKLQSLYWDAKQSPTHRVTQRYELVVKGVLESGREHYEYLFDNQGKMLQRQRINFRNIDNLEF